MFGDEFRQHREELIASVQSGVGALDAMAVHAQKVDAVLERAFANSLSSDRGMCLVALGGYGRGELAPWSDLDLLVLHRGVTADQVEDFNTRFMYPLWDSGVEVGNRVRTLDQTYEMLGRVDEAAATLDARFVCGDRDLAEQAIAQIRSEMTKRKSRFVSGLGMANRDRHGQAGHAGHMLEPNIRDGHGGLRDIQTLEWVGSIDAPQSGLEHLLSDGFLTGQDYSGLRDAHRFFHTLRVHAHLNAGRREDTLLLNVQDELAEQLGYPGSAGGDELMRDVFGHARHVAAVHSAVWDLITHRPHRSGWLRRTVGETTVGDGLLLRRGRIEVVAAPDPDSDPAFWIRVFDTAAERDTRVGRPTISRLRTHLDSSQLEWGPEMLAAFSTLLQRGRSAVEPLNAMEQSGLLEALIPEWSSVRSLPQRNLYHRLSVDAHLFEAVVELVESRSDPELADAWREVADPNPVTWAALLHDIGKGFEGDHSVVGEGIAASITSRAGFNSEQTALVAWLVRAHLVLAETALRRDLADPDVIARVASEVGTIPRLSMLYLLTRADSRATGPEAWTTFRSRLISELYSRTHAYLSGGGLDSTDSVARQIELEIGSEQSRPWIFTESSDGADTLTIVAHDRSGLFADVVSVLAEYGVDVLSAQLVELADGSAAEQFRVRGVGVTLSESTWERISHALREAIIGDRTPTQPPRRRRTPRVDPFLRVDVTRGSKDWIVEVHATDRPKLLSGIARAISAHGADIRKAMIATYGVEIVDVFYVTNVSDPQDLKATIESALR